MKVGKRYELTGQIFGRLKVIGFDHIARDGSTHWLCECSCRDKTRLVVRGGGYDLIHRDNPSCGCVRRESNDISGRVFGRLTVLELDHITERDRTYWLCECSCGNRVIVRRDGLISGHTLSCGCLHSEQLTERLTQHGMSRSRLYNIWQGMHMRCENENEPRYNDYGGRGISVCDEWDDFECFRDWALTHGYNDELSIDRKGNDLGYSPENCRWADRITQQNNRRNSHYYTYDGETHTVTEWSRMLGVSYSTLWYRIARGDLHDFEEYFGEEESFNG